MKIPTEMQGSDTLIISAIAFGKISKTLAEAISFKVFYLEPFLQALPEVTITTMNRTFEISKITKHGPSFSIGWGNDG